jgi:hypothetical protein
MKPRAIEAESLSLLGTLAKRMGAIVADVLADADNTPARELWTLEDACYSIPAHTLSDAAFLVAAMDHKLEAIIDSARGDLDVRDFCHDVRAGLYSVLAVLKANGADLDVGIEHLLMPPAENPHISDAEVWRLRKRAGKKVRS